MYSLIKNQLEERGNGSGRTPGPGGALLFSFNKKPRVRLGAAPPGGALVYSVHKEPIRRARERVGPEAPPVRLRSGAARSARSGQIEEPRRSGARAALFVFL